MQVNVSKNQLFKEQSRFLCISFYASKLQIIRKNLRRFIVYVGKTLLHFCLA